jgi:hypothetical protein
MPLMNSTDLPTNAFSPSASFPMEMVAPLKQPCAHASQSLNPSIRITRYLLATPKGWIADHSKKPPELISYYTRDYALALSYTTIQAAMSRAQSIKDIEPDIQIMTLELSCDPSTYPFGWEVAND